MPTLYSAYTDLYRHYTVLIRTYTDTIRSLYGPIPTLCGLYMQLYRPFSVRIRTYTDNIRPYTDRSQLLSRTRPTIHDPYTAPRRKRLADDGDEGEWGWGRMRSATLVNHLSLRETTSISDKIDGCNQNVLVIFKFELIIAI